MIKIYNHNFNKDNEVFSFQFTFDDWSTDNCIVYNWKNPKKWASENSYLIGGHEFNLIEKAILEIIKRGGGVNNEQNTIISL